MTSPLTDERIDELHARAKRLGEVIIDARELVEMVQEIRAWRASSYIKGLPPPAKKPPRLDTYE